MTLAPYLLALTFGLLISALLHFVLVWPAREPVDEADADAANAPGNAAAGATSIPAPTRRRKSRRRS
jgi:hypothetical protein